MSTQPYILQSCLMENYGLPDGPWETIRPLPRDLYCNFASANSRFWPQLLKLWHDHRIVILGAVILISISIWTIIQLKASQRNVEPPGFTKTQEVTVVQEPKKIISRTRQLPKRVTGSKMAPKAKVEATAVRIQPLVFYFSLTETTKPYANELQLNSMSTSNEQNSKILEPKLYDLAELEHEDFFEHLPQEPDAEVYYLYLLLIPSYNIDTALENFLTCLKETHNDFRVGTAPLADVLGYSVFGFGDREGWPTEAEGFCSQAIEVDKWMAKLTGRKRAFPLGLGDVKSDVKLRYEEWSTGVSNALTDIIANGGLGEGVPGSGDAVESDEEEEEGNPEQQEIAQMETSTAQNPTRRSRNQRKPGVDDLEDLGSKAPPNDTSSTSLIPIDFTTSSSKPTPTPPATLKAMVPINSPTYASLTKQGYSIIGTHSGVKICRWTKSALRGRGSCYKYSFYGIKSHLCMETTPSLSCSNKCVFCWRHGTNPVSTTWRWQVDPPSLIFTGAKAAHYQKIKMLRGVPGLRAARFQEAMTIRHCALSLVGEPIFYPHINAFTALLHAEHISSFLVCNAQHPDQLAALAPVTQLYVSIDASNAASLKKIDRPLHRDYWPRFLRCLDILHEKRNSMRTVYRFTLVKGFNIDEEVPGYAALIARGAPSFVEIKGVTYCGTSTSSNAGLTMQNVPWYAEVVAFAEALNRTLDDLGLEYGIAAEHAHSCCILLASKRFSIKGRWHTRIDYKRFFELLEAGGEFGPLDYVDPEPTPEWAMWGQGGFDPADVRVDRKGRLKEGPVVTGVSVGGTPVDVAPAVAIEEGS